MEELFKSLSESVSKECYDEIIGLVEEIISERDAFTRPKAAKNSIPGREAALSNADNEYTKIATKDMKDKGVFGNYQVEDEDGKPIYISRERDDDRTYEWKADPSPEVKTAYKKYQNAQRRLNDAKFVASGTVGSAFRHEDEHQQKVQAAKEANKK